MHKEALPAPLTALVFDFFYWLSRFEFALKKNKYLQDHARGATTLPGWNEFIKAFNKSYKVTAEAQAHPRCKA